MPAGGAEDAAAVGSEPVDKRMKAEDALCAGAEVDLIGLTSAPELNGRRGNVLFLDGIKGRWAVEIVGHGRKLLKPQNLRPASCEAEITPESDRWPDDDKAKQDARSVEVICSYAGCAREEASSLQRQSGGDLLTACADWVPKSFQSVMHGNA